MTAGWPLRAAGSHAEPLSPLRWSPSMLKRHRTAETRYSLGRNKSRRVPLCQLCHLCHLCRAPALAQRKGDGPQ